MAYSKHSLLIWAAGKHQQVGCCARFHIPAHSRTQVKGACRICHSFGKRNEQESWQKFTVPFKASAWMWHMSCLLIFRLLEHIIWMGKYIASSCRGLCKAYGDSWGITSSSSEGQGVNNWETCYTTILHSLQS